MDTNVSEQALVWNEQAIEAIEPALAALNPQTTWRVGHCSPLKCIVAGSDHVRRLYLCMAVYLSGQADQHAQLRIWLVGTPWQHDQQMPPCAHSENPGSDQLAHTPEDRLHYQLTSADPITQLSDQQKLWIKYLAPTQTPKLNNQPDRPITEQLRLALNHELTQELEVDTVRGAINTTMRGPVGYFGPVEHRILERSGQPNLAVAVTPIAEANNSPENGGAATEHLTLYGERFGVYLLHRRQAIPSKNRNKDKPSTSGFTSSVAVLQDEQALLKTVELGALEKRLLETAGLLKPVGLWDEAETPDTRAPTTAIDLSNIPDRSRRSMQTLIDLTGQGKLNSTDLDLLVKTARHLAKAHGSAKTSARIKTATRR